MVNRKILLCVYLFISIAMGNFVHADITLNFIDGTNTSGLMVGIAGSNGASGSAGYCSVSADSADHTSDYTDPTVPKLTATIKIPSCLLTYQPAGQAIHFSLQAGSLPATPTLTIPNAITITSTSITAQIPDGSTLSIKVTLDSKNNYIFTSSTPTSAATTSSASTSGAPVPSGPMTIYVLNNSQTNLVFWYNCTNPPASFGALKDPTSGKYNVLAPGATPSLTPIQVSPTCYLSNITNPTLSIWPPNFTYNPSNPVFQYTSGTAGQGSIAPSNPLITPCATNTYSSTGYGTCLPCPSGSSSGVGATTCTCASGYTATDSTGKTIAPGTTGSTVAACWSTTKCTAGTYSSTGYVPALATSCPACPVGSNSAANGATTCPCSPGSSSSTGNGPCLQCPAGMTSAGGTAPCSCLPGYSSIPNGTGCAPSTGRVINNTQRTITLSVACGGQLNSSASIAVAPGQTKALNCNTSNLQDVSFATVTNVTTAPNIPTESVPIPSAQDIIQFNAGTQNLQFTEDSGTSGTYLMPSGIGGLGLHTISVNYLPVGSPASCITLTSASTTASSPATAAVPAVFTPSTSPTCGKIIAYQNTPCIANGCPCNVNLVPSKCTGGSCLNGVCDDSFASNMPKAGTLYNKTPFALNVAICGQNILVPAPTSHLTPGTATYTCTTQLTSQLFTLSLDPSKFPNSPSNTIYNINVNPQGAGAFDNITFTNTSINIDVTTPLGTSNALTVCQNGAIIGNNTTPCIPIASYGWTISSSDSSITWGPPYGWIDVTDVLQQYATTGGKIYANDSGSSNGVQAVTVISKNLHPSHTTTDPFPKNNKALVAMINGYQVTVQQNDTNPILQIPAGSTINWAYYGAGCTTSNGYTCSQNFTCSDVLKSATPSINAIPGYDINGNAMSMLSSFCVPSTSAQIKAALASQNAANANTAVANRGNAVGSKTGGSSVQTFFNNPTQAVETIAEVLGSVLLAALTLGASEVLFAVIEEATTLGGVATGLGGTGFGAAAALEETAEEIAQVVEEVAQEEGTELSTTLEEPITTEETTAGSPANAPSQDDLNAARDSAKAKVIQIFKTVYGNSDSIHLGTEAAKQAMFTSQEYVDYVAAAENAGTPVKASIIAEANAARAAAGIPAIGATSSTTSTIVAGATGGTAVLGGGGIGLGVGLSGSSSSSSSSSSSGATVNSVKATCAANTQVTGTAPNYTCTPCPTGLTSQAGAGFCVCPAGSFDTTNIDTTTSGALLTTLSPSACQPCPANATCPESLFGPTPTCNANYYATATGCSACPANTQTGPTGALIGQASVANCQACPANQSSTSGNPCRACPSGYTSTSGGACQICAAGSSTSSGSCQKCPINTYSTAGSSTCTNCTGSATSPAGSTSSAACVCPAGSSTSSGSCQQCPVNTYSTATNSSSCTPCTTGKTSPAGSTSSASCTICPAGSSTSSGSCQQCTANTYSTSANSSSCTPCTTGKTSPAGSTSSASCTIRVTSTAPKA